MKSPEALEAIDYIRQNLTVRVEFNNEGCQGYDDAAKVRVRVKLFLGDEEIADADDFANIG